MQAGVPISNSNDFRLASFLFASNQTLIGCLIPMLFIPMVFSKLEPTTISLDAVRLCKTYENNYNKLKRASSCNRLQRRFCVVRIKVTYGLFEKFWLDIFRDRFEIVAIQCEEEIANCFSVNCLGEKHCNFHRFYFLSIIFGS